MQTRHLLHLTGDQLSAFAWRSNRLDQKQVFQADSKGFADFAAYIAEKRRGRFSLLVETDALSFSLETLPLLRGSERRELIRRRFERLFPGQDLCAVIEPTRNKGKPAEESLLFAAMERSASEPWLSILRESGARAPGIFSPALLAPRLLQMLGLPADGLLLSVDRNGLRQDFCRQGKLRFSRQTPLGAETPEEAARSIGRETQRLRQYLISQHLLEADTRLPASQLPAYLIAPQAIADCFPALNESTAFSITPLTPLWSGAGREVAKSDVENPENESRWSGVFLSLLATEAPHRGFCDRRHASATRHATLRVWLHRLGIAALAAGGLFSGLQLAAAERAEAETEALQRKILVLRDTQGVPKAAPALPVPESALRQLAELHAQASSPRNSPLAEYQRISQALSGLPIVLEEVDWQAAGADKASTAIRAHLLPTQQIAPTARPAIIRKFAAALRQAGGAGASVAPGPETGSESFTLQLHTPQG